MFILPWFDFNCALSSCYLSFVLRITLPCPDVYCVLSWCLLCFLSWCFFYFTLFPDIYHALFWHLLCFVETFTAFCRNVYDAVSWCLLCFVLKFTMLCNDVCCALSCLLLFANDAFCVLWPEVYYDLSSCLLCFDLMCFLRFRGMEFHPVSGKWRSKQMKHDDWQKSTIKQMYKQ